MKNWAMTKKDLQKFVRDKHRFFSDGGIKSGISPGGAVKMSFPRAPAPKLCEENDMNPFILRISVSRFGRRVVHSGGDLGDWGDGPPKNLRWGTTHASVPQY